MENNKKNSINTISHRDLMLEKSAISVAIEQYSRRFRQMLTAILRELSLDKEVVFSAPCYNAATNQFEVVDTIGTLSIVSNGSNPVTPFLLQFKSNDKDEWGNPIVTKTFITRDDEDYFKFLIEEAFPHFKEHKRHINVLTAGFGANIGTEIAKALACSEQPFPFFPFKVRKI